MEAEPDGPSLALALVRLLARARHHAEEDRHQGRPLVHRSVGRQRRTARLNTIAHILSLIPHKKLEEEKVKLPKRSSKGAYDDGDLDQETAVREGTLLGGRRFARGVDSHEATYDRHARLARIHGARPYRPHGLTAAELQTPQKAATAPAKPAAAAPAAERSIACSRPSPCIPDQLLAQMLLCAANPGKVGALSEWLASRRSREPSYRMPPRSRLRAELRGSRPVSASRDDDGEGSTWTTRLGQAFTADRSAVFASIQRLRVQAQKPDT